MDASVALVSIRQMFGSSDVVHDVVAFLAFFASVYFLAFGICRFGFSLKAKTSSLVATCVCSLVHGLFCIAVGVEVLFQGRFFHDLKLDHMNTVLETHMMQFSLAYLLFDTVFSISDPLFLVHHILSVSYLVSVLRLGVGGVSTVFVFFIGEVTSPVFNSFTVLNEMRREYEFGWALKLFGVISPIFTWSFIVVRSFVSIPLVAWYSRRLLLDSHAIPLSYRLGMMSLVLAGLAGSQVWSWKLYLGWRRKRSQVVYTKKEN
jgi:hypothetical protein